MCKLDGMSKWEWITRHYILESALIREGQRRWARQHPAADDETDKWEWIARHYIVESADMREGERRWNMLLGADYGLAACGEVEGGGESAESR